ncbi:MAG TPA: ABC transporter ATP-binding protein [Dissulfurispiraceae bacterium]|nr:ABC transporter ATP-binding protein [Dissulfurispiraceae bacterium]
MNEEAIRAENLTMSFGDKPAVDSLHLDVKRGELFGLVGPDGAGKTTVMRLLATLLKPSSGEAFVAGHSVLTEAEKIKEKIGYMSQRFGLYEELSVDENINFYADLYDVSGKERADRIDRLLGFSNLTPFRDRPAGKLSGGMKQKLGLACALIHTPEVLLLDEPTNGVDPVSRRDFWRILYGLLKDKVTIFVSTSYLDEAERCSRIALMHGGKILANNTPLQVKRSISFPMIEIWCEYPRSAADAVRNLTGVSSVNVYGDRLHVEVDSESRMDELIAALQRESIGFKEHRRILPSIEDIFISMVEKR